MSDIENVYSEYVTFSSVGTHPNRMAFCPLHGEVPGASKPSLCVDVETGSWICFAGCGGGGIKQFLTAVGENKHKVKDKTKHLVATKKKKKKKKEQLEFLPIALLGLFNYKPDELTEEGFDEEVLQYHDIGYDKGKCRITYPVFDREGRLLSVVGRRPTSEFGKYVPYSPKELLALGVEHTPRYRKGNIFWREDKFFQTNSCHDRTKPVILVEGFKAALWLVQAGYNNVMALMGTHLTDEHISTLRDLGKTVILCLDGDKPGIISTVKNCYKLNEHCKVLICKYPGGATQPDDIKDMDLLHEMVSKPVTITKYKKLNYKITKEIRNERRNRKIKNLDI